MTNTRVQEATGKKLRQSSGANLASADNTDVCELLLAELQARRVRLRHLLHLVRVEAERVPARRVSARANVKCGTVRIKRSA